VVRAGGEAAAARPRVSHPVRGRLRPGIHARGRRSSRSGRAAGEVRQVRPCAPPGQDPAHRIYRFYSDRWGEHFWSTDPEGELLPKPDFHLEGPICHVYPGPQANPLVVPLWRYHRGGPFPKPCANCDATGVARCSSCWRGYLATLQKCSACNGTGHIITTGGYLDPDDNWIETEQDSICSLCRGVGWYNQPDASLPCPVCKASGTTTCGACSSTGEVWVPNE
jgi:hypothetical protein